MHHVALIAYPGFELLDASGPISVFNGANRIPTQAGKPPFYALEVVSAAGRPVASSSGAVFQTRGVDELRSEALGTLLLLVRKNPLIPGGYVRFPRAPRLLVPQRNQIELRPVGP